jgi:hypothetical protein
MAELDVESVEANDNGNNLNLVIHLRNNSNQTLHAQAVVRGINYDPATKELTYRLTDRALIGSVPRSWYILPKVVAIDPHSTGTIELKQSRYLTRISPESSGHAPTIEQLPIHEATSVVAEVGWSDKPFYSDPRQKTKKSMPEQVVAWERDVATGRSERKPYSPPFGDDTGGNTPAGYEDTRDTTSS